MLLFLNVTVTDRLSSHEILRQSTPVGGVDRFKYAIASLAVIPFTHVFIYCELAADCIDRRDELDSYIRGLFPDVVLYPYRNTRQDQWETALREVFAIREQEGDELVWFCCDPTQVFIDYELGLLERIQARLLQVHAAQPFVSCSLSHWPEILPTVFPISREVKGKPSEITVRETVPEGFIVTWARADGVQIVSRALLRHWWFAHDYGDAHLPQPRPGEGTGVISPGNVFCLTPLRELVRAYDGYLEQGVAAETYSPLSIPEGFFADRLRVRYGYRKRKSGWLHINPQVELTVTADIEGVDWPGSLETLPLCWQKRIVQVKSAKASIPAESRHYHRDRALLQAASLFFRCLPVRFMKLLRPALLTESPDLLARLHRAACEFVDRRIETIVQDCQGSTLVRYRNWYFSLAHSLGKVDLPYLYTLASGNIPDNYQWFAGDSLKACQDFISSNHILPLMTCLERADIYGALTRKLVDYLHATSGRGADIGPLHLPGIDTWVYLRLVRQVLIAPERPVDYQEIQAELKALTRDWEGRLSDDTEAAPPLPPETAYAAYASYAPSGKSCYPTLMRTPIADTTEYPYTPIEFTQLLVAVTPSVAIALNNVQLTLATGNTAKAQAQLQDLLVGTAELPLDYVAVLCTYAALYWTLAIFTVEHLGVPSVQQVVSLLRDLNCRRLATPGLQKAFLAILQQDTPQWTKSQPENDVERALTYNRIGEALFSLQLEHGAEMAFRQGAMLGTSVAVIHNNLAVLCWNRGQHVEARAHLEQALRLDPTDPDVAANLRALQAA
jgi:tetratricopeptide (TPR) repeat protein